MNPLHQRTTGGAPAASELVPEAHGYGFIAASEVTANVQSATPKVTPPAQQTPEPAPAEVSPESVETPLIEFITDTPAEANEAPAESATASVILSPPAAEYRHLHHGAPAAPAGSSGEPGHPR